MNARTNFSSINMSKITLAASNTPRAAIRKSRLKSLHCSVRICIAKERVRTLVRFRGSFSRILAVDQPIGNVGWGYDGQRKGLRDTGARYSCWSAFSYTINTLNVGSIYFIMMNKEDCRFICYFLALGHPYSRGFAHMRKAVAVNETHLHGKYEGILLSVVVQDTENHIYRIAFCVINKENNMSWTFFFEKMKSIMVDGPDLAHFPNNRYDVITRNIIESINSMLISEREYLVASIFNLISKRFGAIFRKRPAYVLKYKDNKFVSTDEKIINDNMCEDDFFYIENLNVGENQFTMFGKGPTAKVNLLEKSCSCRRFDLVKIPWAYTMAALRSKHGDDYGLTTYQYTSLVYKVEEYLLVYSESINVVLLYSE
ncbi:hypothetical protein FXO37_18975 [Capsicum annuum]|nr:hypothetical protein FXO37_18975 [Capsicum annuum]